jgi:hypothetical protein
MMEHNRNKAQNNNAPCIMCGKPSEATIYDWKTKIRVCANCAVTISSGLFDYGYRIIVPIPGENRIIVADPKTEKENC